MKKEEREYIIDSAVKLANYIQGKYYNKTHGRNISPIKLQKSLYFCFAYWGGFILKGKKASKSELDVSSFSEYLFPDNIEAWVYGPVVPSVYHEKNLKNDTSDIFKNQFVKDFIDNLLDDIFSVNDFDLVELSHSDSCWKKHFISKNPFHNENISPEEIINEYSSKN